MLIIILAFLCLLPCFAMADVCPDGYFIYYIDWDKYDCRIYCNAGTYLANTYDNKCSIVGPGYWAPKSSIKYGDFVVPENGMWDIVNRTFYPNSGDGFFAYSKDNI